MSDPIADFRRSFQEAAGAASAAPSPIEQFKADTWEAAEAAGAQTRKRLDTSNIDVDRINALKIEANRTNDRVTGEAYTPEEKAIASMTPTQLAIRYPDLYNRMYKQTKEARDTMRDVAHAERGTLSAVTDTAVGAGTTLVSGLVDLAALGVVAKGSAEEAMGDAIGNDLASWLGRKQKEIGLGVVEKNHQVLDWINERALSDELQKHQMLKRVKDDAFSEDAAVRKEQKIAEGKSPTVARLEEIFENLDNSIRSGLDDSVITAHETLSSLASLGIARVASKPANMIGGKIADNIAKNALMKEGIDVLEGQTAKAVLTKTALDQIKNRQKTDLTKAFAKMSKVERAEWGSGLGIMMGSSAFADTVTQVNAMTHSELMSQSPGYKEYFRSLLAQGIDAEEAAGRAKARVSGNAGLMSAVVAGTIAAPTAMISAVGSKSWLQTGSLRDMLASTFVKEPIANAIQEGGAGWAANLAIQEFADEDRSLDEGVAQRASQGALIGAGMAGVLGTPTLAKGTLSASGKTLTAAGKAAQKATEPLAEKVAKARTKKANTATPGTPEHASAAYSEVVDSSQEIIENFTKDLEKQGRSTEEIEAAVTDIKKVINAGDTKLTDTTGLSERTSNLIKNSSTTLEAQESILKQFEKAETDKEKLDLALGLVALSNQTNAGTDVLTSLAGEAGIDSLPKNLTAYQKSLDAFEESELVQKAYAGDLMRVFGEYIASQGEGATVDEILFAAEKMPGYVTEAQVDKVFKDESSGSSRQISPAQAAILKAAVSITEAQKKFWKGNPDSSKKGTQAATTRNIFSEPIDNKKQIPLAEHIRRVQNHLLKGNIERAKTSLEVFGLFAQHMMNKKTAMESSTGKKDVKDYVHLAAGLLSWGYASDANSGVASVTETLPDGTVVNYGKGVYHSAKAHELKREAQLVIDVYNSLAESFDVLDMPKVTTAMESIHDKPFLSKEETSEAEVVTEDASTKEVTEVVAEEAPATKESDLPTSNSQIEYSDNYTREEIRNNPDKVYVFGDNAARKGFGGQAKEARGEPNTIGVRTKYAPSNAESAFFGKDSAKEKEMIDEDLALIRQAIKEGKTVVLPSAGIGTGLARLSTKAPEVAQHLEAGLNEISNPASPKPTESLNTKDEAQRLALVRMAQVAVGLASKKGLSKKQAEVAAKSIQELGPIGKDLLIQLTASLEGASHSAKESEAYGIVAEALYNAGAEHISSINVPAVEIANLGKMVDPSTNKKWAEQYNYLVPLSAQIVTKHGGLGSILTAIGGLGNIEGTNPKLAAAIKEGNTKKALKEIIKDGRSPQPIRQAAAIILGLYESSGMDMPSISLEPALGSFGSYNESKNHISISTAAIPKTLIHEALHGLTTTGIAEVEAAANEGNVDAQEVVQLGIAISNILNDNVSDLSYEGLDRGAFSIEEAVAELANPLFVARAAEIKVPLSSLPAGARNVLKKDTSLLSILKNYVSQVLSWFQIGDANLTEESVALSDLLVSYATEVLPKVEKQPEIVKALTETTQEVATKHFLLEQLKDPTKRKTFEQTFGQTNGPAVLPKVSDLFTYPSKNKAMTAMRKSLTEAMKDFGLTKEEIKRSINKLTLQYSEEISDTEAEYLASNSRLAGIKSPIQALQSLLNEGTKEDFLELIGDNAQEFEVSWLLNNKHALGNLLDLAVEIKTSLEDLVSQNPEQMMQFPDMSKYWIFAENTANHGEVDPATGEVITARLNDNFVDSVVLATVQWAVSDLASHSGMFPEEMETASGLQKEQLDQEQIEAMQTGIRVNTAVETIARRAMNYAGVSIDPNAPLGDAIGAFSTLAREAVSSLHHMGKLEEKTLSFQKTAAEYVIGENGKVVMYKNAQGEMVPKELKAATFKKLYVIMPREISVETESISTFSDVLDAVINGVRTRARYVGHDVNIPVPTHQLRNPHTELSDKQKKSIENQNKIVYKIHPKMLSIFRSLGAEGVAKLHGETLPDSNDLDVIREAKEGVLKSFQTGLEETEVLVNMAEEAAGEGESFTDIPIRFAAAVTRVGRTMLLGRATPQGDKVMRHIFLPTNSVGENAINLKDSSSANVVFTALAQGLFDQKIYTKSPAAWREFVEEALTYPQLAEMIDLVNQFSMDSGLNIDQLKNLTESLRSASEGKFDIEWNSLALFNLVELANIQGQLGNKSNEGLRTSVSSAPVETSLYIEQDGINNGAANALMSMTSYVAPNDIPSFIRALESAGITFGGTAVPSYELWERVGTDIYGMSAAEYSKTIDRHITSLKRAMKPHQLEAANKIEKAVDTVLSSFMPSYVHNSETDSRTIGRGATKYRLMERIYGSGINGSAKADLGDMINGIYERINDAYKLANERNAEFDPRHLFVKEIRQHRGDKATQHFLGQKGEELFDAINVLLTHVITPINRYGEAYAFRKEELRPLSRKRLTNKKFKLNSSEFEQIAMNIKVLYSSNVRTGIESVLGEGVTDSMALMQEATHTHSNLYGEYIRLKIREVTKDRPNHRYISQNELRKIVKDSLKFHPTLSIQDKKILVAKTVDSFIPTIDKKSGLAGELPMVIGKARGFHTAISKRGKNKGKEVPSIRKVTYETKQLGDVGVGALANVNISIGDAEMMTDFLAGEVQDLLHVYDGINLPMYSAMEHGETINKAQLDAWFHNPMKAIEELSESTVVLAAEVGKLLENMYRTEKGTTISESEAIPMYNYKSEVGLPDFAKSLVRAFLPEGSQIGDEPLTIKLIKDTVGNTYHRAREASRRREALQNTFKRIGVSSDQMAALGTPYVLEGDGTVELTGDIQADFSRTYEEELAKVSLIAAPQETAATTPPSESLADKQTTNPKAKSISPAAAEAKAKIVEFLETKRELGGERLALLNELLDTVFDSGDITSVFIGSAAELRSRFPKHRGDYKGLISFANGEVEIALRHDANAETVLHELNHAATIKGLNSAIQLMNTPSEIKTQEQARVVDTFRALLRISEQITEGLPESVLEGLHPSQVEALSRFKELVVNEGLNSSQAVAELLAWGRSNRELMDALQDVKIDSKTKSLFKKWINTVEELAVRLINLVKVGQPISRRKYVETMAEAVEAGFSIISEYQKDLPPLVGVSKTFAQSVNDPKSQKNILTSRINTAAERIELTREENIALGEFVNTTSNVFGTTGEDLELHKNLYILFSRPENLDSTLLSELSRARTEAIRNLELSDFVSDDASSQERAEAYKMLNELLIPAQDDTSGLANFAALALTNSQVQKALTNVDTRTTLEGYTGVNNLLTYAGHKLIDGTTRAATGVRGTNSLVLANSAVERMITRLEVGESSILDLPYRKGDQVNDILKNNLGGENIAKAGDKLKDLGMDKLGAAVSSVGGIVAAAEKGILPDLIIKLSSKHENRLGPISSLAHGLVRELVGRTKDNAKVYDMIKQSTYAVDTVRKNFKSTIPGVLRKKFKNLTQEDTSTLTDTMYQGGITGVLGAYNAKDAAKLFVESSYRDSEKAAAETEIAQLTTNNPRLAQAIYSKAEQLAHYITTGEPGINLLQNSYAIAKGYGTNVKAPDDLVTPLMGPIDRLISAYTAEKLDPSVRDRFAELYAKDPSGVDDYFGYVKKVTESEKAKYPNILSANTIFGYMPVETKYGRDVVISPESNHNKMVSLGYTKGEKVVGTQDRYVYFTKHNPKARFGKGIVQIVTKSYMGMDVATGASLSPFRQSVTDSNDVLRIQKEIAKNPDAAKAYVPLYGTNGLVVGYDLVLDKNNREFLVGSGDAFNAIGVWESRQVEEALADSVNQELIGSLKTMWDDAKNTPSKARMFVDITNEKLLSTTEKDALKLIPVEVRTQLVDAFGDSPVFIRRDLLMDVIGRRDASVSDFFTGSSDWSPRTQAFVRNLLISVLGEKAVKTLLIGEDFMQSLTNYARHNIVIASGIVPAINAISSAAQLAANGVPLNKILGEYPKITRELETFVRNRTRLIELDTELKIGGHDALKTQKLVAEMKAIEAANSKLSIKELIDKGELNTIADLGIEKEDMNIFTGRVGEWLSEKLLSLPPKAQEAARIGLVTKDTAYYKAMEKVTLYGDFIPKAILYKHLQAKGKSKEEAYGHITEEFVNYDRLSGRTRGALESVGLIWFFNWKLRSTKIAARTVVNNPLYALTLAAAPLPMGSTMAFSENAISRLLTNNWGSSFGLDPILRSYQLNPVAQVLGL